MSGEPRVFGDMLDEVFAAIDNCIARLEALDQPYGTVCALVLVKARNLGLGCYSLSLDALAQESGALFRPLIEYIELVAYFRLDPARITEALEERLPPAGVIAQRIEGKFKGVRSYLNTYSSHLSVSLESMRHLIDVRSSRLRLAQPHSLPVLRQNLVTLLATLTYLAVEAVTGTTKGEVADDALINTVEDVRSRALRPSSQPPDRRCHGACVEWLPHRGVCVRGGVPSRGPVLLVTL